MIVSLTALSDLGDYSEFKRVICGDSKLLALLLGLQGGCTKCLCFLCLWDSRADHEHYQKVGWPLKMSCSQVNGMLLDSLLKSLERCCYLELI